MLIKRRCPNCGKITTIEVKDADFIKFCNGMHVQDAFPYLSIDDREILLSGICYDCWNEIFSDNDDFDF